MKSKKLLSCLLAVLFCVPVAGLAACGDKPTPEHTHTFASTWSSDETQHWHAATCDHTTEKSDIGAHVDTSPKDGKCDVCNRTLQTEKWHNEKLWLSADPVKPSKAVEYPDYDETNYKTVAVHDPSIFQDPQAKTTTYYAFGSHFMVAMSHDLLYWEQVVWDGSSETSGQREAQKLYGDGVDWRNVLKQSVAHAGRTMPSTWAPDVEFYNGKYYMYVSLTSAFGSNKSIISRVESDKVLGPYSNETVIVKTGNSGEPNAIDPELFYDKDGKLWMVYGSHFAGVYIKELYNEGENWGLPKEEGFGKLLWKGGSKVVEGPFVFYNATTEYYYLMTTYGDLNTDYNMRIARSKTPDGPYLDIAGDDMATTSNNGTAHGTCVAGNYKFERSKSDGGYAACGHNSVIKDAKGRYFVVYHARRQQGASEVTAPHSLRVSQLFFNEDGWPVMSPNGYDGESFGTVEDSAVAKTYEVVLHSLETTKTFVNSKDYTFNAEGKVLEGTKEAGTWELKEGFYINIVIDGETYKGVVAPGWDMYSGNAKGALSFTAVSQTGRSLWAIEKEAN